MPNSLLITADEFKARLESGTPQIVEEGPNGATTPSRSAEGFPDKRGEHSVFLAARCGLPGASKILTKLPHGDDSGADHIGVGLNQTDNISRNGAFQINNVIPDPAVAFIEITCDIDSMGP